jgi:hypothetical protein
MVALHKGTRAWGKAASIEFWCALFGALCLAGAIGVAAQQPPPAAPKPLPDPNAKYPLPDGPGKELVQTDCKDCHTFDRILHAHYSTTAWRAEIKKMRVNGADIKPADIDPLVVYLATHFGPRRPRARTTAQPKASPSAGGGN